MSMNLPVAVHVMCKDSPSFNSTVSRFGDITTRISGLTGVVVISTLNFR